jgi:hypothetical protein
MTHLLYKILKTCLVELLEHHKEENDVGNTGINNPFRIATVNEQKLRAV